VKAAAEQFASNGLMIELIVALIATDYSDHLSREVFVEERNVSWPERAPLNCVLNRPDHNISLAR
jgi:hypothetical protein